jgi:hypothetical protein
MTGREMTGGSSVGEIRGIAVAVAVLDGTNAALIVALRDGVNVGVSVRVGGIGVLVGGTGDAVIVGI